MATRGTDRGHGPRGHGGVGGGRGSGGFGTDRELVWPRRSRLPAAVRSWRGGRPRRRVPVAALVPPTAASSSSSPAPPPTAATAAASTLAMEMGRLVVADPDPRSPAPAAKPRGWQGGEEGRRHREPLPGPTRRQGHLPLRRIQRA